MNELKKIFVGLTASTVVLTNFAITTLPSKAQDDAGGPGQSTTVQEEVDPPDADCPEACGPWAEKLGLSDEQMEKIVSLKSAYIVKTAAQKAEFMADIKKMLLLMTAEKIDRQGVSSLHDEMETIKSNLGKARLDHMLDVMEVMTSKQRSDMRHYLLVHMSSPDHMHGMHHHPMSKWHHHVE